MTKILDRVSEYPVIVLLVIILLTLALSVFIANVTATDLHLVVCLQSPHLPHRHAHFSHRPPPRLDPGKMRGRSGAPLDDGDDSAGPLL